MFVVLRVGAGSRCQSVSADWSGHALPPLPSLNFRNGSNVTGNELPAAAATTGVFNSFLKTTYLSGVIKPLF